MLMVIGYETGLGARPSLIRKKCQEDGKFTHHVTELFVARNVGEIAVQFETFRFGLA